MGYTNKNPGITDDDRNGTWDKAVPPILLDYYRQGYLTQIGGKKAEAWNKGWKTQITGV